MENSSNNNNSNQTYKKACSLGSPGGSFMDRIKAASVTTQHNPFSLSYRPENPSPIIF